MNRGTPGLPVPHHLPDSFKLTSIELVMPSSHLILCRRIFLLPPIPPSISLLLALKCLMVITCEDIEALLTLWKSY